MGDEALATTVDGPGLAPAQGRRLPPGPGLGAREVAAHQLGRIHEAVTQLVAEHGYQALKVRDIVRLAEVSTRAFYEHFASKEDCFLQTHQLISRRASRRIIAAQAGESVWHERSRRIFAEFVKELENGPAAARLVLVEAYTASEAALEQAWRAERVFGGMLAEAFARAPKGVAVPPMIIEGIVAGIVSVSRDRLSAGGVSELSAVGDELVEWAICYPDRAAMELAKLDRQAVWRDTTLEPLAEVSAFGNGEPWSSTGDRALILSAVAKLAANDEYAKLTAARVRAAAGVSRRKFEAHFDDLEDCYLAALEQRAGKALAQAARAQTAASSWAGGIYRAIAALCEHVAGDAFLTRVCLTDGFPPGPNGSRSRQRLVTAVAEMLSDTTPTASRLSPLSAEASTGAIWPLFHRYAIRDRALRRKVAATLSYLALAPATGASAAVSAIREEQGG